MSVSSTLILGVIIRFIESPPLSVEDFFSLSLICVLIYFDVLITFLFGLPWAYIVWLCLLVRHYGHLYCRRILIVLHRQNNLVSEHLIYRIFRFFGSPNTLYSLPLNVTFLRIWCRGYFCTIYRLLNFVVTFYTFNNNIPLIFIIDLFFL